MEASKLAMKGKGSKLAMEGSKLAMEGSKLAAMEGRVVVPSNTMPIGAA